MRFLGLEARRVQQYKRTLRPAPRPSPSSSIILVESATIKSLATRLYSWTRRGRRFRILNVVDDCSREALACEAAFSLPGVAVVDILEAVAEIRGYPKQIVVDNVPEFAGRRLDTWAYEKGASFDSSSPANRHRTRSSKASTVVSAKNASTSTGSSPWRTPSASSSNGVRTTTRFDLTAPSAILRQRSSLEVESSNRPDAQVPKPIQICTRERGQVSRGGCPPRSNRGGAELGMDVVSAKKVAGPLECQAFTDVLNVRSPHSRRIVRIALLSVSIVADVTYRCGR